MVTAPALALHVERRGPVAPHRSPSRWIRFCAALLAAAIALTFVYLLRGSPGVRDDAPPRTASIVLMLPRERSAPMAPRPAERAHPTRPTPKAATGQVRMRQTGSAPVEQPARPALAAEPPHVESPATAPAPASAPLDLSDSVIRSAVVQSKGAVRKLAEASGQEFDTPHPGRDQLLATATAEAGIPGCLRPDALKHDPPAIGPIPVPGIFAAPFVVHAAITGKCKP